MLYKGYYETRTGKLAFISEHRSQDNRYLGLVNNLENHMWDEKGNSITNPDYDLMKGLNGNNELSSWKRKTSS